MTLSELDQYQYRLNKRAQLIKRHLTPYPSRVDPSRSHTIAQFSEQFNDIVEKSEPVCLVGRIRALRHHGDIMFADLEDYSGLTQLALDRNNLGDSYDDWVDIIDIGDFISALGSAFKTKRGEITLQVKRYSLLAKALMPLPDKRKGLRDPEFRFRHRELELLTNAAVRERFRIRSVVISSIRHYLDQRDFLEVETPTLQSLAGGTTARPFQTHHQALGVDLFLRIAPELYLKRLLIGGYERVYEIARCFRNEGIDRFHSPEFTQVEIYQAYADYWQFMTFTEDLISTILESLSLGRSLKTSDQVINFAPPYQRIKFRDSLIKYAKVDINRYQTISDLSKVASKLSINIDGRSGRGKILDDIFSTLVRPKIIQPTFVFDLPIELSPLAKRKADDPSIAERFQLLVAGTELANAFSELNDPVDQQERFLEQQKLREAGDEEAQPNDREYVTAMMYGMPPAAGIGLGIDRLVALLTGAPSLREVTLFPAMKDQG